MVTSGKVDAVITLGDTDHAQLEPIFSEHLFLVSAPGELRETEVRFADLMAHRLILPVGAGGVRLALEQIATKLGVRLTVVAQIDGVGSRKQAVLAGIGKTILPWLSVADEHAAGTLVATPIVRPVPTQPLVLDANSEFDPAIIAALRSIIVDLVEEMRDMRQLAGPSLQAQEPGVDSLPPH